MISVSIHHGVGLGGGGGGGGLKAQHAVNYSLAVLVWAYVISDSSEGLASYKGILWLGDSHQLLVG